MTEADESNKKIAGKAYAQSPNRLAFFCILHFNIFLK